MDSLFFVRAAPMGSHPLYCESHVKFSKNYREAGNPVIFTGTGTNLPLIPSLLLAP